MLLVMTLLHNDMLHKQVLMTARQIAMPSCTSHAAGFGMQDGPVADEAFGTMQQCMEAWRALRPIMLSTADSEKGIERFKGVYACGLHAG